MLWVDKHRPKKLDELDYHKPLSSQLKRMVGGGDFPHMLLYGPSGAGKKTRLMALLREMFGSSVERLRVEQRTFKVGASATPVDLTLVCSSHHIELNPSDAGTRDRDVVQEVIKEIAQSASVVAGAGPAFKVVVLNEVERMSKPAQHALRRTMEKCAAAQFGAQFVGRRAQFSARNSPSLRHPSRYTATCRLLLVCTNPCKVIAPIRSRCLCLRVAAPTVEEVSSVLLAVAHKEGVKCPPALAERIARASDRNLRRAVLTLEACKVRRVTDTKPESRDDLTARYSHVSRPPLLPPSHFSGAAVPDG